MCCGSLSKWLYVIILVFTIWPTQIVSLSIARWIVIIAAVIGLLKSFGKCSCESKSMPAPMPAPMPARKAAKKAVKKKKRTTKKRR